MAWTGLDEWVECAVDVTIFAPTDDDFYAYFPTSYVGNDGLIDTSQLDMNQTLALLQEHVVPQQLDLESLTAVQGQVRSCFLRETSHTLTRVSYFSCCSI